MSENELNMEQGRRSSTVLGIGTIHGWSTQVKMPVNVSPADIFPSLVCQNWPSHLHQGFPAGKRPCLKMPGLKFTKSQNNA